MGGLIFFRYGEGGGGEALFLTISFPFPKASLPLIIAQSLKMVGHMYLSARNKFLKSIQCK